MAIGIGRRVKLWPGVVAIYLHKQHSPKPSQRVKLWPGVFAFKRQKVGAQKRQQAKIDLQIRSKPPSDKPPKQS